MLCLASMTLAVTMHAGYSLEVGILVALATGVAVGAFSRMLIAFMGFPPFVVTLGMLSIARSLAMVVSNNTVVFQFGPDQRLLSLGGGATSASPIRLLYASCFAARDGLRLALDALRPPRLRHRRQ